MRAPRFALALAGSLALGTIHAAAEGAGPALGVVLDGIEAPDTLAIADPAHPMDVRIAADWASIERSAGVYDWSSLDAAVAALASRGLRVTLCVRGDSALYPRDGGDGGAPGGAWLEAWTALLRSAVATFGPSLSAVEIGEDPDRAYAPAAYAFVLKTSSLAVRAEAKRVGTAVRVAQGRVAGSALAWQEELWGNDTAPYVDVLPVAIEVGDDAPSVVSAFALEAARHPPAVEIRAMVAAGSAEDDWASLREAVRALGASAASAMSTVSADPAVAARQARVAVELHARLADGYAPAPPGALRLVAPDGAPLESARLLGRFLRSRDLATLVVYQAPAAAPDSQARLVLDTIDVKDPVVVDLLTGAQLRTGRAPIPGGPARALAIVPAAHPMAVLWERAAVNEPGLDLVPEDVAVATTRGLTAEEIIARNREVQRIQDDRLERWTARGRIDFHFKLAQGGSSLDVSIESNYYWRRGAALEWEQTRYYLNGNLVRWKSIPELPLIQPEKVVTLPLDLTFDKTYAYALAGEDTVEGRPAYVLTFDPSEPDAPKSLYRGRVWIDRETFVRLKVALLQTHLEPPVVSNDETDVYGQVVAPDGTPVTLLVRADGQQLWTAAGRNFVVRREVRFDEFEINPSAEAFDARLAAAYASRNQMLRDTDRGIRYLERTDAGGRAVKEQMDTNQLFALGGAFKDDAVDSVVPLAGVNWFDYDFLKKGVQFEVFFAGVYAYANLTDPSLAGSQIDLGVEASLVGLKLDDKLFVDGVEDVPQRIRRRSQYLSGRFGYPLGNFCKVAAIGEVVWNRYDDSSEGNEALAARNAADGTSYDFVLPANNEVLSGALQLEFNRKGYSLTVRGGYARRSNWEPWGLYDPVTSAYLDATIGPGQRAYATWAASAFKEWYLPHFQKLKAEVAYLDGSDLDRFSQYRFGSFGDESLEGYAGTGVRFDRGLIARGGWAFNVANVIRFDLAVETARVRDATAGSGDQDHTGAGLSFNLVGPWKTIWQASYGRALRSDVASLEGKQEFLLVVLKLF